MPVPLPLLISLCFYPSQYLPNQIQQRLQSAPVSQPGKSTGSRASLGPPILGCTEQDGVWLCEHSPGSPLYLFLLEEMERRQGEILVQDSS